MTRAWRPAPFAVLLSVPMVTGGCLDASRFNAKCAWTGDSAFVIDMSKRSHRKHLEKDVRTAGENAVRYADTVSRRIGRAAWDRLLAECLDTLYGKIQSTHAVTRETVTAARRKRDWGIDLLLVWGPSALLFAFVTLRIIQRIHQRASAVGSPAEGVAILVWVGLTASGMAVGLAHFWGWTVEEWRLRTRHLANRALYLPAAMYTWQAYIAAVVLFAVVAIYVYRFRDPGARPHSGADGWKR